MVFIFSSIIWFIALFFLESILISTNFIPSYLDESWIIDLIFFIEEKFTFEYLHLNEEAKLLTNTNSLLKAASLIQKMGPQYVIIKKGEHGSMLFGEGKNFIIPAYPIFNVVDPTGAGDSFAGGVSGFLCDKKKINFDLIKQAMLYGSVLASFTVESLGIDSLEKVTKNTLNKRLNDFKSITSF